LKFNQTFFPAEVGHFFNKLPFSISKSRWNRKGRM
jgi:hypothetical protein